MVDEATTTTSDEIQNDLTHHKKAENTLLKQTNDTQMNLPGTWRVLDRKIALGRLGTVRWCSGRPTLSVGMAFSIWPKLIL